MYASEALLSSIRLTSNNRQDRSPVLMESRYHW